MKLPPYPKYKATGVEWLSNVPEHWSVMRSDTMVTTAKRQVGPETFAGVEVMHFSIPVVQELGTGAVENGEDIASAKQVIDGPVVLVSRLNPRKATICRAEPHSEVLTLASTEFVALKPTTGDIRFLEYLVSSELFRQRLDSWVQSVTRSHQRARPEAIYRFWNGWPRPDEQRGIAAFLNRETAQIDTLVVKKRTLIERLKERRIALISRTVTRGLPPDSARAAGLDPHPKLKTSGIDWLGHIPEHWQVLPFTKCISDRSDYRGKTPEKTQDGVFLVTAKNVRMGYIDYESSQEYVAKAEYEEIMRRGLPKKGDILFTTEAPLGNVALIDREDIALAQRIIRFRMNPHHFDATFTLYGMMSDHFQNQLQSLSTGSTAEGLKASKLPILRIVAPPLKEQQFIGEFLGREAARIDDMIAKVEAAIERLKEYRTALITAAVTGKIDVRRPTVDNALESAIAS